MYLSLAANKKRDDNSFYCKKIQTGCMQKDREKYAETSESSRGAKRRSLAFRVNMYSLDRQHFNLAIIWKRKGRVLVCCRFILISKMITTFTNQPWWSIQIWIIFAWGRFVKGWQFSKFLPISKLFYNKFYQIISHQYSQNFLKTWKSASPCL